MSDWFHFAKTRIIISAEKRMGGGYSWFMTGRRRWHKDDDDNYRIRIVNLLMLTRRLLISLGGGGSLWPHSVGVRDDVHLPNHALGTSRGNIQQLFHELSEGIKSEEFIEALTTHLTRYYSYILEYTLIFSLLHFLLPFRAVVRVGVRRSMLQFESFSVQKMTHPKIKVKVSVT